MATAWFNDQAGFLILSAEFGKKMICPTGMNWLRHESKSFAFHESPTMLVLLLLFTATQFISNRKTPYIL